MNTTALRYSGLIDRNRDIMAFVPQYFDVQSDFVKAWIAEYNQEIKNLKTIAGFFKDSHANPALRQFIGRPSLTTNYINTTPEDLNFYLARSLAEKYASITAMYWNGFMEAVNAPQLFVGIELEELTNHNGYMLDATIKDAYAEFNIVDLGGGVNETQHTESIKPFNAKNLKDTFKAFLKTQSKAEMKKLIKQISGDGDSARGVISYEIDGDAISIFGHSQDHLKYFKTLEKYCAMLLHADQWIQYLADYNFDKKIVGNHLNTDIQRYNSMLIIKGECAKALRTVL